MLNNIVQQDTIEMIETKRKSIMVIGDSNVQRTKEHLDVDSYKWTLTNKIFTTSELRESLKEEVMTDEMKKHEAIILAQGTNDVRLGKLDGQTIYRNLVTAARDINKITGKCVYINQIPPMNIPGRNDVTVKAAILNRRIADITTEKIHTIRTDKP